MHLTNLWLFFFSASAQQHRGLSADEGVFEVIGTPAILTYTQNTVADVELVGGWPRDYEVIQPPAPKRWRIELEPGLFSVEGTDATFQHLEFADVDEDWLLMEVA